MRSLIESLSRGLAERLPTLPRGLAMRPLTEICAETALVHRSCPETSLLESGDLVQRPGEETGGLPPRSFIDSLDRDLTLRDKDLLCRSPKDTLCR